MLKNGIAGYIVKPHSYDEFVKAFKILNMYWTLNELPENLAEKPDHTLSP